MEMWVRLVRGLSVAGVVLGGVVGTTGAISVMGATPVLAQSVSTIVVQGNRRVEADTIRSYFRTGSGRLDAAAIDQGLKALYATGLFEDVRIGQGGGRLTVTVVEAPVINRIAFEGNKKSKDEQLSSEIQSKARGPLSRATVQSDVQRIVDIYRRNGRFDVRVEPKIIDLPNGRVDLVFEINEGEKTGVKTINFVGNRIYSAYRLSDVIKTGESNLLSFLKNNDIYDPDRVEADRELLRRFYLKNGYADVRVLSAVAEFDPGKKGFVVTFTIDEGDQYKFGDIDVQSNVADVDVASLRARVRTKSGNVYNAEAVEKTVEEMTIEVSKRGYAFAQVRPRGDRNFETRTVSLTYVVEQGARAYIERINVRGNTRTRDYVIRREFDISEGDAYNRVLVDRAERRLKNLNYFKTVKITSEPGSAADRVVLNVDVEEQSTGEFSIAGGYSTSDGFLAEVSVAERNLLGRGQYARAAVSYGQYTRGFELSFVEPYFMDYRLSFGIDLYAKETKPTSYQSFSTETIGTGFRFGIPLREDLALQLRYSVFRRKMTLIDAYNNCSAASPYIDQTSACVLDGEASLAIRQAVAAGAALVSQVGYTLSYNTLDNNRNPSNGLMMEFKQDVAGAGGDVNFVKSSVDARYYAELMPELIGLVRGQAGFATGWGGRDLRMLDHYFMGPNLVRGFASSGIGPRDMTPGFREDSLGGSMYWGASVELQRPIFGLPKDMGMKAAVFADAGSAWGYKGPTSAPELGIGNMVVQDSAAIRSSVGVGLLWDSPFGPIRFDYAFPLTKESYDKVQQFRFSGGTRF